MLVAITIFILALRAPLPYSLKLNYFLYLSLITTYLQDMYRL